MLSKENQDVSNWQFVVLACVTYFFIMSTFGWMSSMSYNIVKQFSGAASRLKNGSDVKSLAIYALYSHGLAAIMTGNYFIHHCATFLTSLLY